jgi:aquaporin Z
MKNYLIEGIGTFFLVLTVLLSGSALAIAAVLAAVIYIGGPISGGHFNPAVSTAVWLQQKLTHRNYGLYVLSQLIGAVAAAGAAYLFSQQLLLVQPAANIEWSTALLAEITFTFLLAFTVLQVGVSKKSAGNQYYGLAIAFVVLAGAASVGTISGGAFNPAVGVGPLLFDIAHIQQHLWPFVLYLVGPLAGGVLASLVYRYTSPDEK